MHIIICIYTQKYAYDIKLYASIEMHMHLI